MKSLPFAALIALQLAFAPTVEAKLSKAESGMAQTVEAEQGRSLALLEKLVNQNSGSLNLEGVEKVGQMMRSEEHTSELQSLMRISYAVFCLQKKKLQNTTNRHIHKYH